MKLFAILHIGYAIFILIFPSILLSSAMAEDSKSDLYPELPVARDYRHVANLMTDTIIDKNASLAEHKKQILSLIFSRMSVNAFERGMLDGYKILKKGHTDSSLRSTPAYQEERFRCEHVTRSMAVMVVAHAHDVYRRKFLEPDEMVSPLFALSNDPETDLIISWIKKKVSETEFLKERVPGSSFIAKPDDKIFFYESPPFSWKAMFGRAGYAVFRDGKLMENVVIRMN